MAEQTILFCIDPTLPNDNNNNNNMKKLSKHLVCDTCALNFCNKTFLFSPIFSFSKISSAETLESCVLFRLEAQALMKI